MGFWNFWKKIEIEPSYSFWARALECEVCQTSWKNPQEHYNHAKLGNGIKQHEDFLIKALNWKGR